MKTTLISICMAAMIGCTPTSSLPAQYATIKLIERGTATSSQVLERTNRVRTLLDGSITLSYLGSRVRDEVGYSLLMPSDRLIIDAVLGDVAQVLAVRQDVPLSTETKISIIKILSDIDRAAVMY